MTSLDRRQFNRSLLAVPAAALVGTGLGALAPAAASAAPADWDAQFLTGQANGRLFHQTRAGDGTWKPSWKEVNPESVGVGHVSCAGISKDLHVVAAINSWIPEHCVRNGSDGSWTAFSPIPSKSGPTTGTPHVAAASVNGQLHVFAASDGDLYHTVRYENGNWWNSWRLLRSFGSISHIAATRVGTTIDTAVVTNGEITHTIRSSGGSWSGWSNVESQAGEVGHINEVGLAGIGAHLHVVALSGSGDVFHAIRKGDGSWQRFSKVTAFADYQPFVVCATNVGGELQVGIIDFTANASQIIMRNIRRSDGSWTQVRPVRTAGLTDNPGILAVAGTLKS